MLHIDPAEESFTRFFSDFYGQLKSPSDFSFFKISEYEAVETAQELQQYVNTATTEEKRELQEYAISIDSIQAHVDQYVVTTDHLLSNDNTEGSPCRYQAEQINWEMMEKLGLSQEKLESLGALEPLLRGYKTPDLIPVTVNLGTVVSTMDARLSLKVNDVGEVEVRVHPIREIPDFSKPFLGHTFSEEDCRNLMGNGNMGAF
ncbi:MAG: DUF4099 domain-containing protein [Chryseobacterium sp.]